MTDMNRLKKLCVASAVTTAWVGAPLAGAAELDMEYSTYSGFFTPSTGHGEEAVVSVVKTFKKATKKKAAAKKATKKAAKKKVVGLYEGADRIPKAVQGISHKISETEFEFNFDYLLDYDEATGESQVVWSILAELVPEGQAESSIAMLIPAALAPSLEGQSWDALFPTHSFMDIKTAFDALPDENGDADAGALAPLDVFANMLPVMPPNFAFFSDDVLTSDIVGAWLLFSDGPSPSILFAEADGLIQVVPEPSSLFLFGVFTLTLGRVRRNAWRWPYPSDE